MRLENVPPAYLIAALALITVATVVQTIRLWAARSAPRRRLALARARGADGERRAEPLLAGLGFSVVDRQSTAAYELTVDGEPCVVALRADFIVELDGRRYVAEVKTGRAAPKVETPATRRQLLEYRVAFDVDGVILVDVDAGRALAVEFPPWAPSTPHGGAGWLAWVALGAVLGAGALLATGTPHGVARAVPSAARPP